MRRRRWSAVAVVGFAALGAALIDCGPNAWLAGTCEEDTDCNDYSSCTVDTCKKGFCQHELVPSALCQCTVAADCDDGDSCTFDSCFEFRCVHMTSDGLSDNLCMACGNGKIDAPGEACDNGEGNSDTTPDACRKHCLLASCGDKVVDTGEQCDDGNKTDGDGCSATCQVETTGSCGNGNVDPGEECDDGNTFTLDGCGADCHLETANVVPVSALEEVTLGMCAIVVTPWGVDGPVGTPSDPIPIMCTDAAYGFYRPDAAPGEVNCAIFYRTMTNEAFWSSSHDMCQHFDSTVSRGPAVFGVNEVAAQGGSNVNTLGQTGAATAFVGTHSGDGGLTWSTSAPALFTPGALVTQPPRIACSDAACSKVVAAWAENTHLAVAVSTDGGASYGTTVQVPGAPQVGRPIDVAMNGSSILAAFPSFVGGNSEIFITQSDDSGATWTTSTNISMDADGSEEVKVFGDGTQYAVTWTVRAPLQIYGSRGAFVLPDSTLVPFLAFASDSSVPPAASYDFSGGVLRGTVTRAVGAGAADIWFHKASPAFLLPPVNITNSPVEERESHFALNPGIDVFVVDKLSVGGEVTLATSSTTTDGATWSPVQLHASAPNAFRFLTRTIGGVLF